jgi:hypothetical protein
MVSKIDVTVPADGGVMLGAWLFRPQGAGPHPAITMAHSAPKVDPASYTATASIYFGLQLDTGVKVGGRKGSIRCYGGTLRVIDAPKPTSITQ